jgi:hypothetical protein
MAKKTEITFKPNDSGLYYTLKAPNGTVGRHLKTRAELIRSTARVQIGKRTGALAMSLYINHSVSLTGQTIEIGSKLPYALFHHEGTRPHIIHARPGGTLRFTGRSRIVYSRAIMHPGTKANKYLTDSLPLIL